MCGLISRRRYIRLSFSKFGGYYYTMPTCTVYTLLRYLFYCLVISNPLYLFAQNEATPIGYWREHLSYQNAQQVVKGDKVYCATIYNVFSIDSSNEVERYSKINGLNDIGVNCIGWDNTTQQLLIAYSSSNVDILKGNTVTNINDIQQTTLSGDKTIYSCFCSNGFAYLCSGLGVIVVDLVKYEIKDTWLIGDTGNQVKVNALTTDGFSFYAATNEGLKTASVSSPNLDNYANWTNISGNNGLGNGPVRSVVYANQHFITLKNDSLFIFSNNTWNLLYADIAWPVIAINTVNDKVFVCQQAANGNARIVQLNTNGVIENVLVQAASIAFPKYALPDGNAVWIADSLKGLSKYTNTFESFVPNSPPGTATGEMMVYNNTLYAAAGSVTDQWNATLNPNGIYTFNNDQWNDISALTNPVLDTLQDFITVAVNPIDQSIWAGSYGGGLATIHNGQVQIFKQYNSSLQVVPSDPTSCRVSGLAFDQDNNLWISNYGAPQNISVRKADGTFRSFSIPYTHVENAVSQLVVDDANQLWIMSPKGNGVFCYNHGNNIDAINDDHWKFYQQGQGLGNLPSNNVFCIAKDKNSFIWIGTDRGIGVVQCATNVVQQNCDAVLPVVQNDNFAGYLFQDEQVKTIAVDGANRKWVGTLNGIWLVSEEGDKTIYNFTESNSPLLSNDIKRITVDPQSGEVYIATAKGLCSFRSTATNGGSTNSNVLVFPNPVPPGYNGTIAIKGVVDNALVKIAELNGRLVYQTRALGGQAVWDGKNYKGEKAMSGIYLVIIKNDDGTEKTVTKIAITGGK